MSSWWPRYSFYDDGPDYWPEPPPSREELYNDRFFMEEARPDYDELMERDDNEVVKDDIDAEEWASVWVETGVDQE